jgi:pimeloyl-ACP methyl ester carboxylesterase
LFGDKSKVSDELVDVVLDAMAQPGAGEPFRSFQMSEITKTGIATNLFCRLQEIHLPTLLVHGTKDTAVPVAGAVEAQKRIEGAKMHLMDGCKHWPQKERPMEFAEAVASFVQSV